MTNYVAQDDLLRTLFVTKEDIVKNLNTLHNCTGFGLINVKDAIMNSGVKIDYDIALAYELYLVKLVPIKHQYYHNRAILNMWGPYLTVDEINKICTTLELLG